jgi:malate dehydrogenase (oxaloacetate-decarboxylating)(NADP+)
MKPVFTRAKEAPKRVIYAEGEDERVLRATQVIVEEGLAQPLLIGRPNVVETRLERYGLSIRPGRDFTLINPDDDPRYREYVNTYVEAAGRRGITPDAARTIVRTNATVIAALAVRLKLADAMICGLEGRYMAHLKNIRDVIGLAPGVNELAALSLVITNKGAYFLADTQVTPEPNAQEIADMAVLAAAHVRRFGLSPKIALLSHSDFGSFDSASSRKMRHALTILRDHHPGLEVEGEMNGDTALSPAIRERVFPNSRLKGEANVLIMPNLDAANIAYQMTKVLADALAVGPIRIGAAMPAHILTPSVTARGVIYMTALAVVVAQGGGPV